MAPFTGPGSVDRDQPGALGELLTGTPYNKTHKTKIKFVNEDTQLGSAERNGSRRSRAHRRSARTRSVLGVVGPAGSNEVKATTAAPSRAQASAASPGSATNTTITTDGTAEGLLLPHRRRRTRRRARASAGYITAKLKVKRVYIIDDQEAYSIGLADEVQSTAQGQAASPSRRDGVSQQQSDFSSLINEDPAQHAARLHLRGSCRPKGQAFGQQMKSLRARATSS